MRSEPEGDARGEGNRRRILILDPDPRIGEALTLALRQRAQVEGAASGLAGLLIAAEREVDLVLVQAHLPDMCSGDFLHLLRLLRPGVPIALFGTDPPQEGSLGSWADVYFPEPLQLKPLLRWIDDRLDRSIPPRAGSGVASPPVYYEVPVRHLEIVQWVLEFIERHHREGVPLTTIAQAAGVSRSHLCRVFKRVTGLSLKRFLTRRRLQAAKVLLQEPGTTIEEVARRIGYRDATHFDRVFRRWEGLPPSAYRRQTIFRAFRNGLPSMRNVHPPSCPQSST
jgi:AraC-like DNA-binding protein